VFCKDLQRSSEELEAIVMGGRIDIRDMKTRWILNLHVDLKNPLQFYSDVLNSSQNKEGWYRYRLYITLELIMRILDTLLVCYPNSKNSAADHPIHERMELFRRWYKQYYQVFEVNKEAPSTYPSSSSQAKQQTVCDSFFRSPLFEVASFEYEALSDEEVMGDPKRLAVLRSLAVSELPQRIYAEDYNLLEYKASIKFKQTPRQYLLQHAFHFVKNKMKCNSNVVQKCMGTYSAFVEWIKSEATSESLTAMFKGCKEFKTRIFLGSCSSNGNSERGDKSDSCKKKVEYLVQDLLVRPIQNLFELEQCNDGNEVANRMHELKQRYSCLFASLIRMSIAEMISIHYKQKLLMCEASIMNSIHAILTQTTAEYRTIPTLISTTERATTKPLYSQLAEHEFLEVLFLKAAGHWRIYPTDVCYPLSDGNHYQKFRKT
jgi:hypothetical protein